MRTDFLSIFGLAFISQSGFAIGEAEFMLALRQGDLTTADQILTAHEKEFDPNWPLSEPSDGCTLTLCVALGWDSWCREGHEQSEEEDLQVFSLVRRLVALGGRIDARSTRELEQTSFEDFWTEKTVFSSACEFLYFAFSKSWDLTERRKLFELMFAKQPSNLDLLAGPAHGALGDLIEIEQWELIAAALLARNDARHTGTVLNYEHYRPFSESCAVCALSVTPDRKSCWEGYSAMPAWLRAIATLQIMALEPTMLLSPDDIHRAFEYAANCLDGARPGFWTLPFEIRLAIAARVVRSQLPALADIPAHFQPQARIFIRQILEQTPIQEEIPVATVTNRRERDTDDDSENEEPLKRHRTRQGLFRDVVAWAPGLTVQEVDDRINEMMGEDQPALEEEAGAAILRALGTQHFFNSP